MYFCCCSSSFSLDTFAFIRLLILLWSCLDSWISLFHFFYPTALVFRMCSAVVSFLFPFFLSMHFFFFVFGPFWVVHDEIIGILFPVFVMLLLIMLCLLCIIILRAKFQLIIVLYIFQMDDTCPSTKIDNASTIWFWTRIENWIALNARGVFFCAKSFFKTIESSRFHSSFSPGSMEWLCGHGFFAFTVRTTMYANIQ